MDLLLTDARIATMSGDDYGVIDGGAIAISEGRISWIGPQGTCPPTPLGKRDPSQVAG